VADISGNRKTGRDRYACTPKISAAYAATCVTAAGGAVTNAARAIIVRTGRLIHTSMIFMGIV
jgi:hypothetical protein